MSCWNRWDFRPIGKEQPGSGRYEALHGNLQLNEEKNGQLCYDLQFIFFLAACFLQGLG